MYIAADDFESFSRMLDDPNFEEWKLTLHSNIKKAMTESNDVLNPKPKP